MRRSLMARRVPAHCCIGMLEVLFGIYRTRDFANECQPGRLTRAAVRVSCLRAGDRREEKDGSGAQ
jgi:hypothetical protein